MKSWSKDKDTETYSTHDEGKSVAAEEFIRILKNKIYKYVNLMLKNVYIDKLVDIVSKCNNTYHITITIKPVDVKFSTYIDFKKENVKEDPKFKVGNHVRISCSNFV